MTSIDTTPIRRRKAGVKGQKKERLKIDMTPMEFANLQMCELRMSISQCHIIFFRRLL